MDTDLMKDSNVSAICEQLKQDDFRFKEEKFDYLDVLLATGVHSTICPGLRQRK